MIIPENTNPAMICSEDETRPSIHYVKVEDGYTVATCGRRLVVSKAIMEDHDYKGELMIAAKLVQHAIESATPDWESDLRPPVTIHVERDKVTSEAYGFPSLSHTQEGTPKFPDWKKTVPGPSVEFGRVHLDAKLLLDIARSMDSTRDWITLDIPLYDEDAPIVVTGNNTTRFGLLKLCRGSDSHELSANSAYQFAIGKDGPND